jgi:MarR family 2-MHQ and catechol resistance regulon transcriptional repressor
VPTHYRGSDAEVQALDAYIKLVRASESVAARLTPLIESERLTASQFGALEALYHRGPMCQRDLAQKLLKSSGNVTLVVDNLEKRGLVSRVRDRKDRRYVEVHLTDEGRRVIEAILPRHVAAIVREMRVLTPAEQAELGRLCKALGRQKRP